MKRIYFDIFLLISIFIFPWWISALLLLIGIFIFKNFYEFIIGSSIIFIIYSPENDEIMSNQLFFASIIILFYIGIQYFKSNIILYKKND